MLHFRRTATADTEIRGQAIKAGDQVVIWHISANRDEEVWDDPFVFDITRDPNPHVAFGGGGSHFCLGANLARTELRLIFKELATRLPDMQLAGEPDRLLSNFIGGIKHMPVKWTPGERVLASTERLTPPPGGILSGPIDGPERTAAQYPHREATPGMRVLHRASGFTGELVALDGDEVVLRGHTGLEKRYRNLPGTFAVDGTPDPSRARSAPVGRGPRRRPRASPRVAAPRRAVARSSARRHGSRAGAGSGWRACTTPSWSRRCGATTCASRGSWSSASTAPTTWRTRCAAFGPGPGRRLGVLLDHLVAGSKEARLAAAVRHPHVLVTGTPYVDVWQAVRPGAVGIEAWPVVPKGQDWKTGICRGARRRRAPRDVAAHPRLGARLEAARAAARRRGRAAHRLRHHVDA